ncbi:MAG: methylmalonyl-CoA mutase, partial [Deltaproteobacteria bacterium]|nr:methylmalonyl-CoA mutase [Deltaproteobacteria bacterium]
EYIEKIDALGGMVAAILQGFPQREIERRAYEHQQAVERKERIIVGVNEFTMEESGPKEILRIDPKLEREQAARVRDLRARRNTERAQAALAALEDAARGTENVMPRILDAVKAFCTVGEISDAMRRIFGEHRPTKTL